MDRTGQDANWLAISMHNYWHEQANFLSYDTLWSPYTLSDRLSVLDLATIFHSMDGVPTAPSVFMSSMAY